MLSTTFGKWRMTVGLDAGISSRPFCAVSFRKGMIWSAGIKGMVSLASGLAACGPARAGAPDYEVSPAYYWRKVSAC